MKIKNKLTLQFTVIAGAILLLFSFSVYYFSSQYRQAEFYSRLKNKAENSAKLLIEVKDVDAELLKILDKNLSTALVEQSVHIYNHQNQKIYDSDDENTPDYPPDLINRVRLDKELEIEEGEKEVFGLLYTDKYNRFVVIVSAFDKYGKSKLKNLRIVLITGLLITVALLIVAGLFFSEQALKPISRLVQQVAKINIANLHTRVNTGNGKDEIAILAVNFNTMLDRLQEAFEIQRSFVSNASHELRTPLAAITSQIEVTVMKHRSEEEYEKVLFSILEDTRSLTALTNGLLQLAQTSVDFSRVELNEYRIDDILLQAQTMVLKKYQDKTVSFEFEEMPEDENFITVKGNESLLKTVFYNLMENGFKFSENDNLEIKLGFNESNVIVQFQDRGIGISGEDLPKIFEPFFRAENARSKKGHGIGLSLVRKIIELHGGSIIFTSELNHGTKVEVTLPHI